MSDIVKLKEMAESLDILYVDDNKTLREQATKLLKKIFSTVYPASDGSEALLLFEKYKPPIVITDIKMPNMDGIELSEAIHKISPDTKIIIMSAFDSNENLISSINNRIFKFLKKPVNVKDLTTVLTEATEIVQKEKNSSVFHELLKDVFENQSTIVLVFHNKKITMASQEFLNFFQVSDINEFYSKYHNLGNFFLKGKNFLYDKTEKTWLQEALENPDKLFNVKLSDISSKIHHFILKLRFIPSRNDYSIITMDDITELNLLDIYNQDLHLNISKEQEQKNIFNLLKVIKRNNATLKLHNYYKGLSIVNNAYITKIENDSITVKTNPLQQKAIFFENVTVISSEILPQTLFCKEIVENDFQNQTLVLKSFNFMKRSPLERKSIRVKPDKKHEIKISSDNINITDNIKILDISIDAVKISVDILPAKLKIDNQIKIDIILYLEKSTYQISSDATLYRKAETDEFFELVFLFKDLSQQYKKLLTEYISKRQMQLIREFKGLKNEK